MATRAVTSTMIAFVLILLVAGWPTGGQTGLVRFYESVPDHLQPDRRIPINDYAMHGPIVDDHEFPRDLREPYPGKSFGPMGPIDGSLPDDVSFRSLSSGQEKGANSIELLSSHAVEKIEKHKPEYKIMSVEFHRVETPFVIGIWIFFASIAKIGFHMTPKLSKIFPESCLLIVVGVVVGVLLFQASSVHVSPLTPDTFFLYMLPPIILDAGYFMPNRLFFDHLGTILLFAVVGTIFNTLSIGASLWVLGKSGLFGFETPLLQMFLFSALISAVDPVAVLAVFEEIHVNEILYIVVFGESLLNDAVTVVLYHMFEAYNEIGPTEILYTDVLSGLASFFVVAIGGTIIGVIWGFGTGFVTRFTHQVRVIEPIFIFVMAYLAYLNAEIFHMSSILAITFCGITMKNYVEANISHKSHTTVKYTMKMLSSSSETIIFMFLGVATVNNHHDWNTWFVVMTIVFCSIYRIVGVIFLTALANQFRLHKLNKVEKFVMSYGGLRGAVAFALVLLIDPKHVSLQPMFVTTTIAVIYFTVFIQGITIKPLVKILNVKRAEKKKPTMNERIHERIIDHVMAGIEDILGKHGNYHVRDKFKRFDNKFIRPYLVRNHYGAEPKILETYSKLAMKDALDYIRRNASTIGNISGTESMSAIFRNYSNTGQFNGSPSCSQLEAGWNIDLQELEYNPSKKDLTDARIHHLLAEELCKPYKRHGTKLLQHRRLSYSRHAVNDRDLSTQVNYKMHMNIRRMMGEHKHRHKRSKKLLKDGKQNHVSFPEFQQNGSTKLFTQDYINGVLYELENGDTSKPSSKEDWDSAITFTARTSDSLNVNTDGHHGVTTTTSMDTINTDDPDMKLGRDESYRVTTPTATETMLPWKREDDYDSGHPIKQNEFPAWCSNKEYLAYSSPSATFLGGIEQPKVQSVIGLFRRESVCTPDGIDCQETVDERDEYTLTGTEQTEDSPTKTFSEYEKDNKKGPTRRVSMMELGSMEKSHSDKCTDDGSHSLPECWNAQRVRMTSFPYSAQVPSLSTALITSSSESSEEIDEEEEKA
ncbi:sodium/hydrogen exchanger 3 isoform X1 [Apis cerana]|uniref:Sodium/hydrogen exchanger n=1 Tax=Apis cerana TaxID=7461 RepID=V9I6M0_APICE|nr:sodium/hydrogen exchanger 3 isoform X1 [Apis cerana]XP_016908864.1 sodium/hydrogen exchanger 3 isoform X1 [Apis cerana]XP_016908865.1 sodium/hydrogen exchanger 3 isoform X1 [Apis cerana]XP_016908866.1 sodium/hydrogen exchanger 3 isoform X1 [Apis cerana]